MKQGDIKPFEVYVVCNYYSKTLRPTDVHIKVVEKHVARSQYYDRKDSVRGWIVEQNENGEWIEQRNEEGEQRQRIVRSRDLMTIADVAALRDKEAAEQAEREERQRITDETKAEYDGILAHKLGIPVDHVNVSLGVDREHEITVFSARIEPAGIDMVLAESDISGHLGVEDIEKVLQGISDEGEMLLLTPHEIAVRIVGRNGNSEESEDEEQEDEGEFYDEEDFDTDEEEDE